MVSPELYGVPGTVARSVQGASLPKHRSVVQLGTLGPGGFVLPALSVRRQIVGVSRPRETPRNFELLLASVTPYVIDPYVEVRQRW